MNMRSFNDLTKEEKRIEIMKYLQEPHTREEVYEEFHIHNKPFQMFLHLCF